MSQIFKFSLAVQFLLRHGVYFWRGAAARAERFNDYKPTIREGPIIRGFVYLRVR